MKQLSFNLQTTENSDPYSAESFVLLDENSAAFNFLQKFFTQKDFSDSQFKSLIIKGSSSSGKTHLLNVFAKKFGAQFLQVEKINHQDVPKKFVAENFYILEDINKITDEELLLHLINSAVEAKAFLILSCINRHHFQLRDLSSRLKNIFSLQIKDPSPTAIEILLANAFAHRQIKVSSQITKLIAENISRSYAAIFEAVKKVEDHCNESGKNLTSQKIKEIFLEPI